MGFEICPVDGEGLVPGGAERQVLPVPEIVVMVLADVLVLLLDILDVVVTRVLVKKVRALEK